MNWIKKAWAVAVKVPFPVWVAVIGLSVLIWLVNV